MWDWREHSLKQTIDLGGGAWGGEGGGNGGREGGGCVGAGAADAVAVPATTLKWPGPLQSDGSASRPALP